MYVNDIERETYSGDDCPHPALHAIGHSRHRRARAPALLAHAHAGWELCAILDGEVHWWVEDERWRLRAGSVYLTRPGEKHGAVDGAMQPCRLLWCQVADESMGAAWRNLPRRSWSDEGTVAALLERLLCECRAPDPLSTDACGGLLTQLRVVVRRQSLRLEERHEPEALARIRRRLLADPAWWPTVTELVACTGLGRTRLFQLAQEHWQEAPLAHCNRLRARVARERLLAGDDPVTVIAYDLGYASSQHFATAFRRASGFAPSAYRHQHMDA